MKEFNVSKQNKKDKITENDESELLFGNNDPIDNKINKDLKEIKDKLNAEKLSDEFKANLKAKLLEELNKPEDTNKAKVIKFPAVTRKLIGLCTSLILIFTSCFVCADDIENVILELFGKTDKVIANAIEEGNYKEINMDYVEDQGISIKVDYVVMEDDELYIAFNVLGDEYDKVFLTDINIKTKNNVILYKKQKINEETKLMSHRSYICEDTMIIIYKLTESKIDVSELKNLEIEILGISFVKNDTIENKKGNWNLEINI